MPPPCQTSTYWSFISFWILGRSTDRGAYMRAELQSKMGYTKHKLNGSLRSTWIKRMKRRSWTLQQEIERKEKIDAEQLNPSTPNCCRLHMHPFCLNGKLQTVYLSGCSASVALISISNCISLVKFYVWLADVSCSRKHAVRFVRFLRFLTLSDIYDRQSSVARIW